MGPHECLVVEKICGVVVVAVPVAAFDVTSCLLRLSLEWYFSDPSYRKKVVSGCSLTPSS
jgi:hypothetical protein